MATSSYYKAAEWAKSIKLSEIESLEWLTDCTIRQLRAIADKINHENKGWVFCQATLGKILGRLTKAELAVAIWEFVSLKRSAPRTKYFDIDECGNCRIVTERPGSEASAWTTNIGFANYKSAEKVQKYLHSNGQCNASVIRASKRCDGWKYELKVWLLSEKALNTLIAKENTRINSERKQVTTNWYDELVAATTASDLCIFKPDGLNRSARIMLDGRVIGSVGQSVQGYWYNRLPGSAISRNMPVSSFQEGVDTLVKNVKAFA